MNLPRCARCNQHRAPDQLIAGRCLACRRKHTCTQHPAGSAACYSRCGCRCAACRQAGSAYSKRLRHDHARRQRRRVDAAPIAAHIRHLIAAGMGRAEIAQRTGISRSGLVRILRGEQATIRADIAGRALTVQPRPVTASTVGEVDACGTRRRLQALVAIGWSQAKLAEMLGVTPSMVAAWLDADRCFASTRRRVAELYDRLWSQIPAPSPGNGESRARNYAAARGWAVPLAWDDGLGPRGIDNPDAEPYTDRTPGKRSYSLTCAEIEHLIGTDSADQIAARLGYADYQNLSVILTRAGQKSLADRFKSTREVA